MYLASQRFAENNKWIQWSSISDLLWRYWLICSPITVFRSTHNQAIKLATGEVIEFCFYTFFCKGFNKTFALSSLSRTVHAFQQDKRTSFHDVNNLIILLHFLSFPFLPLFFAVSILKIVIDWLSDERCWVFIGSKKDGWRKRTSSCSKAHSQKQFF